MTLYRVEKPVPLVLRDEEDTRITVHVANFEVDADTLERQGYRVKRQARIVEPWWTPGETSWECTTTEKAEAPRPDGLFSNKRRISFYAKAVAHNPISEVFGMRIGLSPQDDGGRYDLPRTL